MCFVEDILQINHLYDGFGFKFHSRIRPGVFKQGDYITLKDGSSRDRSLR